MSNWHNTHINDKPNLSPDPQSLVITSLFTGCCDINFISWYLVGFNILGEVHLLTRYPSVWLNRTLSKINWEKSAPNTFQIKINRIFGVGILSSHAVCISNKREITEKQGGNSIGFNLSPKRSPKYAPKVDRRSQSTTGTSSRQWGTQICAQVGTQEVAELF